MNIKRGLRFNICYHNRKIDKTQINVENKPKLNVSYKTQKVV